MNQKNNPFKASVAPLHYIGKATVQHHGNINKESAKTEAAASATPWIKSLIINKLKSSQVQQPRNTGATEAPKGGLHEVLQAVAMCNTHAAASKPATITICCPKFGLRAFPLTECAYCSRGIATVFPCPVAEQHRQEIEAVPGRSRKRRDMKLIIGAGGNVIKNDFCRIGSGRTVH